MKAPSVDGLETGSASDAGRKRAGEPNQDAVLILEAADGRPPLFIVADGMGGHAGGAVASQVVVDAIVRRYRLQSATQDPAVLLPACLQHAHQALIAHAAKHPELSAMGSTAVIASLDAGKVTVTNVGDSRAYLLRACEITQLSFDHSVVADQVRAGLLTPLQALRSPKRNRLTQSLSAKRKEIRPYCKQVEFLRDDVLLLCTDGLWGVIPEATLIAIACELPPQEAADKLVQQAVSYGGPDNISVILVRTASRGQRSDLEDTNPGL